MQQYLPFTVLKHGNLFTSFVKNSKVATVLTVYGIETGWMPVIYVFTVYAKLQQYLPFTVLKRDINAALFQSSKVATVLTVYGIETD